MARLRWFGLVALAVLAVLTGAGCADAFEGESGADLASTSVAVTAPGAAPGPTLPTAWEMSPDAVAEFEDLVARASADFSARVAGLPADRASALAAAAADEGWGPDTVPVLISVDGTLEDIAGPDFVLSAESLLPLGAGFSPEDLAEEFTARYHNLLGLRDHAGSQVLLVSSTVDSSGWFHLTYEQFDSGDRVLAAQLRFLFDPELYLRGVRSTLVPIDSPSPVPVVSMSDAASAAAELYGTDVADAFVLEKAVVAPRRILREEALPYRAWVVDIYGPDLGRRVLVDVETGVAREWFDLIERSSDIEVYDAVLQAGPCVAPFDAPPDLLAFDQSGGDVCKNQTGDVRTACELAGDVYAYWADWGYNGFNGTGHMGIRIHYPHVRWAGHSDAAPCDIWIHPSWLEMEVVAHEYGHKFELHYAADCGDIECNPLEEHYADANAMFVIDTGWEAADNGSNRSYNDLVGEEYADRGIGNHAVYLLRREPAQGSEEHHGVYVTGIGRNDISYLYYWALSEDYLSDYFYFRKWRDDLLLAVEAVPGWGPGSVQWDAVSAAWDSVGVWGKTYYLTNTGSTYGTTPALVEHIVSTTYRLYLFWVNTTNDGLYYIYKTFPDGSWTNPASFGVSARGGTYPAAVRYNNELYVFYQTFYSDTSCKIAYRKVLANGSLGSPVTLSFLTYCASPAAAVYGDKIYLFYLDYTDTTSIRYRTYSASSGWGSESSTGASSPHHLSPAAAATASKLYLFYVSGWTLNWKYRTTVWSAGVQVLDGSGDTVPTDQAPGVAEYKDKIHITVKNPGSGGQHWYYLVYDPAAASFSENVLHDHWGTSPWVGAMAGFGGDYILYHVVKGTTSSNGWYQRTKRSW